MQETRRVVRDYVSGIGGSRLASAQMNQLRDREEAEKAEGIQLPRSTFTARFYASTPVVAGAGAGVVVVGCDVVVVNKSRSMTQCPLAVAVTLSIHVDGTRMLSAVTEDKPGPVAPRRNAISSTFRVIFSQRAR